MRTILGICIFCFSLSSLFAQQISKTDSLESLLDAEHELVKRIDLYYALSRAYSDTDIDKSYAVANQALTLAVNIDDEAAIGKLKMQLGDLSMRKDELEEAEQYYNSALPYLENSGLINELIQLHLSIGNRHNEKDNYSEAMEHYHAGIRLAEDNNISKYTANLYNNLGVIYIKLNNPEKALELYSVALELFRAQKDTINVAGTTTNIGSIYLQLEDYDISRSYYQNGLELFESINHIGGKAHAIFKLGLLETEMHNYEKALAYLHQSLEIQNNIDQSIFSKAMFLAETYVNLGIIYFESKDFKNAEMYLLKGHDLAFDTKQNSLVALSSEKLSEYYKLKGKFETSLGYYEVYKQYSDSLFNEDNVKNLTRVEMQNQFEQELRDADIKQLVTEQKRKSTNLIYLVVSLGLTLILIIVILLLRLEKNKKKKVELEKGALSEKLDHTNKELTTYVMYSLRKNEFILNIIEKLKKARLDAKPENKKIMAELISELKSNTDSVSWEEFEVRFQEVHTDFYTKLRQQFPDLSTNEIRLCAFFRLNMSTKEIAAITYQSLNSIKVARYRLRKKLKLPQKENLITFLGQY